MSALLEQFHKYLEKKQLKNPNKQQETLKILALSNFRCFFRDTKCVVIRF